MVAHPAEAGAVLTQKPSEDLTVYGLLLPITLSADERGADFTSPGEGRFVDPVSARTTPVCVLASPGSIQGCLHVVYRDKPGSRLGPAAAVGISDTFSEPAAPRSGRIATDTSVISPLRIRQRDTDRHHHAVTMTPDDP